ncbi:hypothetical protein HYR99_25195 [Candidatus Poribacteria bacterium]|nr:hypothetical protein [Candidatus Poribacteria bacterium]
MGELSNSMQDLVAGIRASLESRRVVISEMKSDTHNLLERFDLERRDVADGLQDMAHVLKKQLSSDKSALIETTEQFLNHVRSTHQQTADTLRATFATANAQRTFNEAARHQATQQFMTGIHSAYEDMSHALEAQLASDKSTLMETTEQFLNDVRSVHQSMADALKAQLSSDKSALIATTEGFLNDVRSAHQQMADALKARLSSDKNAMTEAIERFLKDVRFAHQLMTDALNQNLSAAHAHRSSIEAARQETTQQFIGELADDHRLAQEIWRGKGFVPHPIAEEETVEETAPTVVEEVKAEPVPTEEERTFSPANRISEVIANHPEGIRLVDIGNELGVEWRSLIGTVTSLLDEGSIYKIDNLYYPKSGDRESEGDV